MTLVEALLLLVFKYIPEATKKFLFLLESWLSSSPTLADFTQVLFHMDLFTSVSGIFTLVSYITGMSLWPMPSSSMTIRHHRHHGCVIVIIYNPPRPDLSTHLASIPPSASQQDLFLYPGQASKRWEQPNLYFDSLFAKTSNPGTDLTNSFLRNSTCPTRSSMPKWKKSSQVEYFKMSHSL